MQRYDPVRLEIFRNLFSSIAEEMGVTLLRSAFSPNIKERRDFSCAIFDGEGRMIEQAAHIPVHLGSMPLSVQGALGRIKELMPGDVIMLNDPFSGGTHLPDITLITPVFIEDKPLFFLANRAHHSDVGGISPGSMSLAREVIQEGIRIPPVKLLKEGVLDEEILSLILANVRTPEEREGDLRAQIAANEIGRRRMLELVKRYGLEEVLRYSSALLDYAERMMRSVIRGIPDGIYTFTDYLDDDGVAEGPIELR
ncbi:TPA: hydantoinase B/oxoprolinase family protein, partial [Candidatus Poribacteria bacterium]|nr:hydantoinase B/oxoprolinase family protein [Candidatus Poribacteria bacterium]